MSTVGGYLDYRGRKFMSTVGVTLSTVGILGTVGDIISTVGEKLFVI